jgi:exosortase A
MASARARWRSALLILACTVVLLILAYRSTVASLLGQWLTSTYSQALLVFPLAWYLAWRRRRLLVSFRPTPSYWMLLWIFVFAFGWLLGVLSSTAVVQHFCLVAILVGLICGQFGTSAARLLAMPLLFLLFAVPMGDSLIPLLQDFSAWFAVKMLDLTGVPVLLDRRMITTPSGRWEVAEACSGLRYLLASLTIGFVYADLIYRSWRRRVAFLLACAVVPVLANGFRIYGIVLIDYLGAMRLARSADHIIAGWIFLSVITMLLFSLGMRWREETPEESFRPKRPAWAPDNPSAPNAPAFTTGLALFAILGLAIAGAAPLTAYFLRKGLHGVDPPALGASVVSLPWSPAAGEIIGWRPEMQPPDTEFAQSYSWHDRVVELYVAYYRAEGRDVKLVSSTNRLFNEIYWEKTAETNRQATVDGSAIGVHQISIRSPRASLVLWSWYWVDGKFTGNKYEAKWLLAKSRLTRGKWGSAMIVAATEEKSGQTPAVQVLGEFSSYLSFSRSLPLSVKDTVK